MQMEDRIHLRPTNRIEMHQMPVVGQEIVVGAASPVILGMVTMRMEGAHIEVEHIPWEHRVHGERMVDSKGITCGFDIPPFRRPPDQQPHEDKAPCRCYCRSTAAIGRWNRARLQARVAYRGCDDTSHSQDKKQSQYSEENAQPTLHLQC